MNRWKEGERKVNRQLQIVCVRERWVRKREGEKWKKGRGRGGNERGEKEERE